MASEKKETGATGADPCPPTLEIYADADVLAHAAAAHFTHCAAAAIAQAGRFSVALSGGSSPREAYTLLGGKEFAPQIDWKQVYLFWGDERCVPPDSPQSNYRLVRETILDHVPIPAENVHRIQGERPPEEAAKLYEEELRSFFAGQPLPRFDLAWQGLGEEGHTASLFPGSPALHEQARWTAAVYVDKLSSWRVTLTPPAINAAAQILFLVSGAEKAWAVRQVLEAPYDPDRLPAQVVRSATGRVVWMVDRAAAGEGGRMTR